MASYYASDSTYRRTYDHTDPSTFGRSYDRVDPSIQGRSYGGADRSVHGRSYGGGADPSVHGQSYGGADPSLTYGGLDRSYSGLDRSYGSDRSFGSHPATTHVTSPAYDRRGFDEYVTRVAREYIQPSGRYPARGESYDSLSRKEHGSAVPTYASHGTSRLGHGGWNASSGHPGQLSSATTDIGTAVHYLDEAARTKIAPAGPRYAETTSKTHSYVDDLEPLEPAKRYGSYNLFSRRSRSG